MNETYNSHEEFQELCAQAHMGILSPAEQIKLTRHLSVCAECAEAYGQYRVLSTEGMAALAWAHAEPTEAKVWNEKPHWKKLLARVRQAEGKSSQESEYEFMPRGVSAWATLVSYSATRAVLAAPVVVALVYGAFLLGTHRHLSHDAAPNSVITSSVQSASLQQVLDAQSEQISRLESEGSSRQAQLERLRSEWASLQRRTTELASSNEKSESAIRSISDERDALAAHLAGVQQAYADSQKELATVKSERDKILLEQASVATSLQDLKAAHQEQERRLRADEQYLAADRDIRELMGARKLYIADVFDVDSSSRPRKPYGRVFYTENKSLIFYAFDLDGEPRLKNAAFQVWGEKDAPQGEKAHALNLGILYMDSESNKRWVLRSDDPKQLAEIDAVFVTVEPHGGSAKPTSKPFLYALLRKEANHP